MSYVRDFFSLIFPDYCAGCDRLLIKDEDALCIKCQALLPRTHIHDQRDNKLERVFWGRAELVSATAFLKMPKVGTVHNMIHDLKYHDNKSIGHRLGALFGNELKQSQRMSDFDVVVPVPLHPKKLAIRGYNQCDCICEGLSEAMNIPVSKDNLVRTVFNPTQTRKSRYSRWENVESIFKVKFPSDFAGKRLLLVDDVITTGSTIEACAQVLRQVTDLKLSVGALAIPV